MFYTLALLSYIIDMFFGEFEKFKFIKHPIIFMGNYISWFEKKFYKDSVFRGVILTLSLLFVVFVITFILAQVDSLLFQAFLCSFTLAGKMLFEVVRDVVSSDDLDTKRGKIAMLVSRDTTSLSDSDVNKAAVETYAENLSDGLIAPLFYLICFGIVGAYLYKAINTLDSMVGYRNEKYEKFGKFSAKLDDFVNYIPARITAILIAILFRSKKAFLKFKEYGKKHDSPNAGLPISAMALSCGIKLGGPTSYFGKIKNKPFFGEGREEIKSSDVTNVTSLKYRLDMLVIVLLGVLSVL